MVQPCSDFERFAVLDHAPIGHLILSGDFTVLFWNRCLETWTGIPRTQIVGTSLLDRFPHLQAPKYAGRIEGVLQGGPPTIFSTQLHPYIIPAPLPGGKFRHQYTVITALPAEDDKGYYAFFAIQDVTSLIEAIDNHRVALKRAMAEMEERKKAERKLTRNAEELKKLNLILQERSNRDGLTGLFNHRHFYYLLRRDFLLARRHRKDLVCLIIDLDHFKKVNDTHGHPCGDYVLKKVAEQLKGNLRETDFVARYGGEEFAVLLPQTDLKGGLVTAEEIRGRIEQETFRFGSIEVKITCSVGIASLRKHAPELPQELLHFADKALYQAKTLGRNRVVAYRAETAYSI